jgi:hypothetical protein
MRQITTTCQNLLERSIVTYNDDGNRYFGDLAKHMKLPPNREEFLKVFKKCVEKEVLRGGP